MKASHGVIITKSILSSSFNNSFLVAFCFPIIILNFNPSFFLPCNIISFSFFLYCFNVLLSFCLSVFLFYFVFSFKTSSGKDNERRLTGLHETSKLTEFTSGVANRFASVRIPRDVAEAKAGFLEDRRPAANSDPYLVKI